MKHFSKSTFSKVVFSLFLFSLPLSFSSCKKNIEGVGKYTYRLANTAPSTWNPTDWKTGGEGFIISRTGSGLYDFALNKTHDGYETVCELAEDFPEDVTELYAGNKKYGVPSSAKKGWAWKIKLIKNAKWDDGTPITAASIEYSIKQFLNPKMKNYRASTWYEGPSALANAKAYYDGKITDWSDVGFEMEDDYTITFILTKEQTFFLVCYSLGDLLLVKEDLYEANKKQTGDIIKSSYGTSLETSASYGPYKITSYQPDKMIVLEKNENWYGWTDGRHEGQYQTTGYEVQFITDHNTVLNLFLQGKLDATGLSVTDLHRFGNSDFRQTTPESYTWRFSFNSDKKTLKDEETPGVNHSILSYIDFRHGITLALDRQKFVNLTSPASEPGYGLLNHAYIANPETGETYRSTKEAESILLELYETDNISDITGYDIEKARSYIQKAYDLALKNGDIQPNDKVQIDFHTYNTSDGNMRNVSFFQDAVNDASIGTSLEGKIFVKQITDENYLSTMTQGKVDVAISAWGGSTMNPYDTLWCYASPEAIQEYGFNSRKEMVTINIDGKNITHSLYDWYLKLCEGEYITAPYTTRNTILARCEKAILENYCAVPLRYSTATSLISHRIQEASDTYINSLVEFGGERFRKFLMDDAEWDAYCKRNKNQLSY